MADVSSYRCVIPFARGSVVYGVNEVRAKSDPAVSQNPIYWAALTDAQLASGGWLFHQK